MPDHVTISIPADLASWAIIAWLIAIWIRYRHERKVTQAYDARRSRERADRAIATLESRHEPERAPDPPTEDKSKNRAKEDKPTKPKLIPGAEPYDPMVELSKYRRKAGG